MTVDPGGHPPAAGAPLDPASPEITWETVARFAAAAAGGIALHFGWLFWNSGKIYIFHEIIAMDLLVYTAGLLLLWLALVEAPRWRRWTGPLILATVVLVSFTSNYVWTHSLMVGYGTDDLSFQHYGAALVLRGIDPYPMSMRPAFDEFHVPLINATQLQNGSIMDRMSWPAGSFLIFAPFVALGVSDLRWIVLLFQLVAAVVLYYGAPRPFRPLVLVPVFAVQELMDFTGGGVMDFVWVLPILLMVIWRHRPLVMGLCYGIACAIKQVPWFLAPFLLIYLYRDREEQTPRQRLATLVAFGLAAAGVFLAINGPFIAHDPLNWVLGTLEPALGNLIPIGQGPSTLTQLGFPVPVDSFVVLAVAIGVLLLINYLVYFNRLRDLVWFFPALIAWFMPRSLHNYYVFWIPVIVLVLALRSTTVQGGRIHAA